MILQACYTSKHVERIKVSFLSNKLRLTASQVVRLISLLVFTVQKIVCNAQDGMAELVVPLRKEIKATMAATY